MNASLHKVPLSLAILGVMLSAPAPSPRTARRPGRFVVEHPTLLNLGFEWAIRGDANRNATVAVQFRAVGESAWRPALPLVRIGGENVYRERENLDYTVPDGFAGSILNLQPGDGIRVPVPADRSGRDERPDRADRAGEDAQRAAALQGRAHAARLPAGLSGPAPGTELHEPLAGLLRRGAGRLERRLGTAGAAGRHDPDACRPLQARAAELRRPA